jgi:quercetin dioxygenase-like cupin family protein
MADKPITRQAHEGTALWVLGGLYEVKVASDETGDAFTVVQMTAAEGNGPPPHVHPGEETLYVVEGRVKAHYDGATEEAGPGAVFYFPRGTREWFEPVGTVTVLVTYTPGHRIDKLFAEIGEPAERRELPPPATEPPDFERLATIAERYGLKIEAPQ